ncbi:MAG: MCP four helix bundle domain-containing protein [Betaproteobacteria bacterium]|nr:MCP four helix bundle domain-containing protein [Betaproteobacteria bacterium]
MFIFANMKIRTRLSLAFAAVLLLLVAVAVVGGSALSGTKARTEVITQENNVKISQAVSLRGDLNLVARSVRNVILYHEPQLRAQQKERIANARKDYDEKFKALGALIRSEAAKKLYAEIEANRAATRPELNKVMELAEAGKEKEAVDLLRDKVQGMQGKWFDSIQAMIDLQEKQNAESVAAMNTEYTRAVQMLIGISIVAVLLGVLFAWWVTRSITRPLGEAVGVAQKVAAGDLTSTVEVNSKDETGVLLQALKDMNESLKKIVGEVRSGSEAIGSGTKQIASGNADLSQRTEEQASSLEETASSMEELTSTVKQNAENAKQANQLALGASAVAVKGGEVVGQVVTTMSSINESSKKIVDIIGVIDGIAFQTNILALNAAVEAARAGEQGRGFAVVASEVRNLAQRSAAAAKEIKALIGDSVDKVGAGTKLVDEAGKTMEEIVTSVKRVTDIMSEITAASQEQSAGIEQVNQAITQMDEVTQQNAALVEESAAAAESLEEQAQNLETVVAVFNIGKATAVTAVNRSAEVAHKAEKPARPPAERRGPSRPPNVARLPGKAAAVQPAAPRARVAAGGGKEQWEEF